MGQFALTLARIGVMAFIAITLFAAGLVMYTRSQGLLILSVQTGSMQPAISPGDALLVKQSTAEMKVGDIISYRSLEHPDAIITHRLVAINEARGQLIARGDALSVDDPPITADRVVGVASQSIPLAGYIFDFIRQPLGLILAVYLPSLSLVAWEILRLMRHYSSQRYSLYYY